MKLTHNTPCGAECCDCADHQDDAVWQQSLVLIDLELRTLSMLCEALEQLPHLSSRARVLKYAMEKMVNDPNKTRMTSDGKHHVKGE